MNIANVSPKPSFGPQSSLWHERTRHRAFDRADPISGNMKSSLCTSGYRSPVLAFDLRGLANITSSEEKVSEQEAQQAQRGDYLDRDTISRLLLNTHSCCSSRDALPRILIYRIALSLSQNLLLCLFGKPRDLRFCIGELLAHVFGRCRYSISDSRCGIAQR